MSDQNGLGFVFIPKPVVPESNQAHVYVLAHMGVTPQWFIDSLDKGFFYRQEILDIDCILILENPGKNLRPVIRGIFVPARNVLFLDRLEHYIGGWLMKQIVFVPKFQIQGLIQLVKADGFQSFLGVSRTEYEAQFQNLVQAMTTQVM